MTTHSSYCSTCASKSKAHALQYRQIPRRMHTVLLATSHSIPSRTLFTTVHPTLASSMQTTEYYPSLSVLPPTTTRHPIHEDTSTRHITMIEKSPKSPLITMARTLKLTSPCNARSLPIKKRVSPLFKENAGDNFVVHPATVLGPETPRALPLNRWFSPRPSQ